jgi:charged multivesicular body protein 2A
MMQMKMNQAVNTKGLSKMMAEFERENMKSEMMQEIMGEMLDDAMEEPGDEEETDQIVSQVLDEIGIEFNQEVPDAPATIQNQVANGNGRVSVAAGGVGATGTNNGTNSNAGNDSTLNDLEARLNNLNKDD